MLEGSSGLQLCRSPETSQCRSWRRIAPRDCSKMGEKERQSCYFLDMTVLQRAWFSMLFRIMKANIKKYNEKIWKQWFWVVGIEDQEDSGEVIVIFVLILLFYLIFKILSIYDFNTEKNECVKMPRNQNSQIPSLLLAQILPWYPKGCECDWWVRSEHGACTPRGQLRSRVQSSCLSCLNLIGLGLLDPLQTGLLCEFLRDCGRRTV